MTRLALLVGIDDYPSSPLTGCVKDASAMAERLRRNADGSPNFGCWMMLSSDETVTRGSLREAAETLFNRANIDVALFYFVGHGAWHKNFGGYLGHQNQ